MLSILFSWSVIGIYAYLFGRTGITLFYSKRENALHTLDVYMVCGMMILTVYAQFFSLIYKVGAMAFAVISVGAVFCAVYLKCIDAWDNAKYINFRKEKQKNIIILVGIVVGTLLWTNIIPQHYDTGLYHAQAIRWIEEYGVVPGLGNLHFRFAYNSAFLPLQALFSFSWINGHSLHTINGFIVVCMFAYTFFSFQKQNGATVWISDLLKLMLVVYLFYVSANISSPNTDILALFLLFYVCIKWSEFAECKTEGVLPYSFLCILCVYSATVKLSVAVFVLLAIYPAIILLQNKQWKQIGNHILAGIVVVTPWLIRNVIISGYLIYPYPEIDFFQVDWKMPRQTAMTDRREIIAWGRGNYDVGRYRDTITEWFPEWFRGIHVLWKGLFVIAIIALLILFFIIIRDMLSNKNAPGCMLGIACICGMIFWLLSAPLPRYGIVYMIFLPCIVIGRLLQKESIKNFVELRMHVKFNEMIKKVMAGMVVLYSLFYFLYCYMTPCGKQTLFVQNDYENQDVIEETVDGVTISRAVEGDQTGYSPFPSTPYLGAIESIELRGNGLEEGFRLRNMNE